MNNRILQSLSYGLYAVGVKGEKYPTACIVNTVFQITSSPMMVAISINHANYTNECIKKQGEFTVSVLSENTSGAIIGALGFNSGRESNKLQNVRHKILREGAPVVQEDICCWFLCKVRDSIETTTHTIFIGELTAGSEKITGTPMTYKFYHDVIKGKSPKFLIMSLLEMFIPARYASMNMTILLFLLKSFLMIGLALSVVLQKMFLSKRIMKLLKNKQFAVYKSL